MRNTPIEAALIPDIAGRPATGTIRHEIRVCRSPADFARLRPAWDALAAACRPGLDFAFGEVAADHAFARGETVSVALVSDGAALVALWPVMITRRGVCRVARTLGCGNDEEYGGPLLADPADARLYAAAIDAVRRVEADVLELRMLDCDSLLAAALSRVPRSWVMGAIPARWRRLPGYSIALSSFATYDAFLATRPESLRGPLRRRARRLAERGEVEYGWCQSAGDAREVLTWLFANKRRWAFARGFDTAYLMDDQVRDFFIDLAGRIDLVTTPLVSFVKVKGTPVAAALNLVGPRSIEYYITTYDEAYAAFSVGNLLVDSIVRWAYASGRDFDFRPYFSAYKERWSNRETWHESHSVMLTLRGRLAEVPLAMEQIRRIVRKVHALAVDLRAKVPALGAKMPQAPGGTSKDE
ncbi:Protein involved in cellulose biosynthesis (CelD)-like protein [Paraburkholderia ribeironis]|uniref:Protein involved in cellulose biosynthesis (CelD)-like protein n=1 Tax=Paraburkholderia ribeironis TaxID=1247936 RepID=A0A1N7S5Z2_9BURK|nr:GNAT family N-acetyltransferase [Paraburkholderia ribeironis]SIT42825.1 Protein involved in cellulose biosynthesis (CelD)-like protein [Paraburkholderia ribeironis]